MLTIIWFWVCFGAVFIGLLGFALGRYERELHYGAKISHCLKVARCQFINGAINSLEAKGVFTTCKEITGVNNATYITRK